MSTIPLDCVMRACAPAILVVAAGLHAPVLAQASESQSLDQAIRAALAYSPDIIIARSRQDTSQAEVSMARAEGLPSVDATIQYNRDLEDSGQYDRGLTAETAVSLPLFRGGSVANDIRATKARLQAAGTRIEETEAAVVLDVARAYSEVLKNRKIVLLNQANVANLEKMLAGIEQRLKARDLTRTDLDQAWSRLQLARGRLETARASLEASHVEYQRLTGMPPGQLQPFPNVLGLPPDAEEAVVIATGNNPALLAARVEARSSRFNLQSARGALLPQVYATLNSSYAPTPAQITPGNRDQFGTRVGVSMRMGLFQGGARTAGVRIAEAGLSQAEQRVIDLERSVEASTRATYAQWKAARTLVEASRSAVEANAKALSGVRLENAVGTRTILDILNAEQELRDSQEQLASAERDVQVATIAILATIGKGRPDLLELSPAAVPEAVLESAMPGTGQIGSPHAERDGASRPDPGAAPESTPTMPLPAPASPVTPAPPSAPDKAVKAVKSASEPLRHASQAQDVLPPDPDTPAASPAPLPPGRQWVVQAGAFDTLPLATVHWQRVLRTRDDKADSIRPAVYRATIAGKPWFRLAIAGFADWNAAQGFCLTLKQQRLGCLVRRATGLGEPVWPDPGSRRNDP